MRREVLEAQDAALGAHALHDRLGDRALVEALGTFCGERSKRRRELRVSEHLAVARRPAVDEQRRGARVTFQSAPAI